MADKKISQLPTGNLTSETIFPVVAGGITSQITYQDIQDGFTGGTSGGNSYIRGWETDNEVGTSVTLGKGVGKITLTNGSNAFVGIDGANFDGANVGSIGYNYEFTVILSDGTRRYIKINKGGDITHGTINTVYFDNKQNNQENNIWINATGDYDYYPYFISETTGVYSYAQGFQTTARGSYSHAEGQQTIASGNASHAEGGYTQAIGSYSHAGGLTTEAIGNYSFVHGYNSVVIGDNSVVLGRDITGTTADTTFVDNLNIKQLLSLNVITTPSSPQDGQIWLESNSVTGLKIRLSGVTRTITIS